MKKQELLRRINNIRVYKRGQQRTLHKPLTLLFYLSELQKGKQRLHSFKDIIHIMTAALEVFGLRTKSINPIYPFWRLQNDGLAEVVHDGSIVARCSNTDPTKRSLERANAFGGFTQADHELLSSDISFQSEVIHNILDSHFPPSIHEEIIRYFGLRLSEPHSQDNINATEFRKAILSAYDNTCSITGFSNIFGNDVVGVEATHIFWPQLGGNDAVCNGIALNTLHRKLYQLGLFSITPEYEIHVSTKVISASADIYSLQNIHKKKIRLPKNINQYPSPQCLNWHYRFIYRG